LHIPTVELHHDRCDVTANLALSKRTDYKGGGTMLVDIDRVIRLEKGEVLLHPGSMVHGGMDITEGTRYLLVTFAHLK
jgi:predicted 2-oxoglutarate/Fe(II)-dependent dioxygenase YbiX